MSHEASGVVNRRKLTVLVLKAEGLKAGDHGGTSDPFVELHWQSGHGTKKHSSTHEKTVNPVWNEEFEFQVENELTDILEVSVYDRNKISTNELLGVCEVPVAMVVTAAGPVTAGFPLHERHHPNKHTKGQLHLKLIYTDKNGHRHDGHAH